jgi:NDP-sugar pyrophosphorylase family protein
MSRSMIGDAIAGFATSPFAAAVDLFPWVVTGRLPELVSSAVQELGDGFELRAGDIAVHRSAAVEAGAVIKGPAIIGARCFVAAGAYVRGGCWLDSDCILGPGAELKTTLMFAGSKLAHFNFVGDSILGVGVNVEAGAIIANYRNEQPAPEIAIVIDGVAVETGATKFGALVGDGCRIGANAVVAPGAILLPRMIVPRLALVDQSPRRA